jgi:SAM-dependent methyltransferase/ribosomal protein S27E
MRADSKENWRRVQAGFTDGTRRLVPLQFARSSFAMACRICGIDGEARVFPAREMMFGWRHPFTYVECAACGSLQITVVPPNLPDYYPADYYAYETRKPRPLESNLGRRIGAGLFLRSPNYGGVLSRRVARRYPFLHWAKLAGATLSSAVLDVGCGSGEMLRGMLRWGFSNLTGIDVFAREELHLPGLRITRDSLETMTGLYDFISFNHVLEHVVDPLKALRETARLLTPDGVVLIRIPVAASEPARTYGADWFQLDAPRHLGIPSRKGMARLAERAGFIVTHTEFDTTAKALAFSEHYRQGRSMREAEPLLTRANQAPFRRHAVELNRSGDADSGVFVLRRERRG